MITGTGRDDKWRTREPQRAILDAFGQPEIEEINVLKSSRFGWTSIVMAAMGYFIDQDPCPILMVQPRMKDVAEWSKDQVQPTIDASEHLSALVAVQKTGSSGNTIDHKKYPGGPLRLRASNSPDGFRRYPARVAMCDEVDGYPATSGPDGNVIGLIYSRIQDAWNRILANGSTPTEADISLIQRLIDESSIGYPFLTCPHCDEPHIRQFRAPSTTDSKDPTVSRPIVLRGAEQPVSHLVWEEGDPTTARYVCPSCAAEITQKDHADMLNGCTWIGEHWEYIDRKYRFLPGFGGRIGFSTWAGYVVSPNTTPAKLVARYERDKKSPETLKTFVNTVLGKSWREPGEELRSDDLYARREEYAAEVPAGVAYLSAGVDVQGNRWEMEVVGWGHGEESWSVDYQIIPGDPTQDGDWWEILRPYLFDTYRHASGIDMPINAIGIDHGFLGKRVEAFVHKLKRSTCFAFKGVAGEGKPFIETEKNRIRRLRRQKASRFRPELLGDFEAKLTVMQRLRVGNPGPGYCHFPADRGKDWFQQLTSEKLVTRYRHQRPYREWIMLQPRNEALDCRKMAYAAMLLAKPDLSAKITAAVESKPKPARKIQIGRSRTGIIR